MNAYCTRAMTAEIERQEAAQHDYGRNPAAASLLPPRCVRRRVDTVLTPEAPTFCLRPGFANIHAFEALGDCAVLDLLLPPYDDDAGRACHYFVPSGDEQRPELVVSAPPPGKLVIRNEPPKVSVVGGLTTRLT